MTFTNALNAVFRREFASYFATPVAYVFITVFLFMTGILTFFVGNFFERGQADLVPFFAFLPWLFLFLIPAISMRLWAEERRAGSIELLMTLPLPLSAIVLGKFLAAWAFTTIALLLTFPLWLTVNWLGAPDNGVILASYFGAILMAGGYLSIGAAMSATTRNQVIAFVLSATMCFLFTVSGAPMVLGLFEGWAPAPLLDLITGFSFLTHFNAITQGVIDARDLVFFLSLILFWLYANAVIVDLKKAD